MGFDIEKNATDIAEKLDAGKRDEVDAAMNKCFSEIFAQDPANARVIRRQFIQAIDKKEKDGVGDDLTIKMNGQIPKHYTILPADLDQSAKSIADRLDKKQGEFAYDELMEAMTKIEKQNIDETRKSRDGNFLILAIDAYEKEDEAKGEKDDVKIDYDSRTNQPTKFEIEFTPDKKLSRTLT